MAATSGTCPFCSHGSTAFICTQCLNRLLTVYHSQTKAQHQANLSAIEKTKGALVVLNENRQLKAQTWEKKDNLLKVQRELERLDNATDEVRTEVLSRRAALEARRKRLRQVRSFIGTASKSASSSEAPPYTSLKSLPLAFLRAQALDLTCTNEGLAQELAETRRVLLAETLEALDVKGLSQTTTTNFGIASLEAPPIHCLLLLPKSELNAVLVLLVHLLQLVSTYLGIELPFAIFGNLAKPLIRASRGHSMAEKYSKSYPLYMSSGSTASSSASALSSQPASPSAPSPAHTSSKSSLKGKDVVTTASHAQALAVGVKMLAYDAYYLQQIANLPEQRKDSSAERSEIGVVPEDDILSLLHAACTHPLAGLHSHTYSAKYALRDSELPSWLGLDFLTFSKRIDTLSEKAEKIKLREVAEQTGRGTYTDLDADGEDGVDPFEIDHHRGKNGANVTEHRIEEEEWDVV